MSYSGYPPYGAVPPNSTPAQPVGYPNFGLNVPQSGGTPYPSMPSTGYPAGGYPPGQAAGYPASGYLPGLSTSYPGSSGTGYPPTSAGYPGSGYSPRTTTAYPGGGFPQPPNTYTYSGGSFPPGPPTTYPGSGFPSYPPSSFPPGCYSTVPPANQSSTGFPPTIGQSPSHSPYSLSSGSQIPASTLPSLQNSALGNKLQPANCTSCAPSITPFNNMASGHGTVVEHQPFDPQGDAQILRKAMKGLGTDEKTIIKVLAHRTNTQRQHISVAFKTMFGKDLIEDLKSELSGKFEDTIIALMIPYFKFLAKEVHQAIAGLGTDEDALVEILCTRNNWELQEINQAYYKMFGKPMERDIRSDTSGHFERLLVSMCMGSRDEGPADPMKAKSDAQALYEAGVARWGTDESIFNVVLASRSFAHLSAVLFEYLQLSGHSVAQAIDREMSGNLKTGMLAVVRCVENRPAYFAEKLYKAMKGFGTNDRTLIRIIVTRSEIDLATIRDEYQRMYGKSLEKAVADDTSGDYKRVLVELISG